MSRVGVVVLLVVGLSIGVSAHAQSISGLPDTFCGGLSETDCALFHNVTVPNSARFEAIGVGSVTIDADIHSGSIIVNGQYTADAAILDELIALQELPPLELAAQYTSFDDIFGLMETAVNVGDAEIQITADLPDIVTEGMLPRPFSMSLWMVDGIGYVDLTELAALDPSLGTVYGIDVVDVYRTIFGQFEAVFEEDMFTEQLYTEEQLAELEALQSELFDQQLAMMSDYVTITRIADQTVNNQPIAVFEIEYDLAAYMSSQFDPEILQAQMDAMMAIDGSPADEAVTAELISSLAEMNAIFQQAFAGTTLTYSYWIGQQDAYLYQSDTLFSMRLNADEITQQVNALMGLPAEMAMSPDELGFKQLQIEVLVTMTQFDFNTIGTVQPPANAVVIPTDALMYGTEF